MKRVSSYACSPIFASILILQCLFGVSAFDTGPVVVLGTRGSPLALAQAEEVKARLKAAFPDLLDRKGAVTIRVYKTTGDIRLDIPLADVGGKGLFTKELDIALLRKDVNMCVHSTKDLPTALEDGTVLAAVLPREDVRDSFLAVNYPTVETLPPSSVVGTASLRRAAQVLMIRPDLKIINFRGNLGSRLAKLRGGKVAATFLALAGLKRLGQAAEATKIMSLEEMLPAVGQGAIGLQVLEQDEKLRDFATVIGCRTTLLQVSAERCFLAGLGGDCRMPIAANARINEVGDLTIEGLVASPDGAQVYREIETVVAAGDEAESMGFKLAARIKERAGADFITRIKHWPLDNATV